jgi:hypothetical protein
MVCGSSTTISCDEMVSELEDCKSLNSLAVASARDVEAFWEDRLLRFAKKKENPVLLIR